MSSRATWATSPFDAANRSCQARFRLRRRTSHQPAAAAASRAAAIISHHQSGVDVELVEELAAAGVGLAVGEGSGVGVSVAVAVGVAVAVVAVAVWVAVAVSVVVAVCVTVAVAVGVAVGVVALSVAVPVLVGVTGAVGVVVSLGAGAPVVVRSGVRDVDATERDGSTDTDSDPDGRGGRLLPQADTTSPIATKAASPTTARWRGTELVRGSHAAIGSERPPARSGLMRARRALFPPARAPEVRRNAAAGAIPAAQRPRVGTRRQRGQQHRQRRGP